MFLGGTDMKKLRSEAAIKKLRSEAAIFALSLGMFAISGAHADDRLMIGASLPNAQGAWHTVESIRLAADALCGLAAAFAAIILTARVSSGQPTLGASLPLESLAAVVLGGASLSGGRGNAIGVGFGVAFISILSNGLNLLGVSSFTQMMIVGAALICAVAFDQARR
jgi:ribose/xylose/arabinose/galactoside ABC-type transport system permease subunit